MALTSAPTRHLAKGVKKRHVGAAKGKWLEELTNVLWSICTTLTRPTSFTPFKLLFEDKAMMPEELKAKSYHVLAEAREGERIVLLDLVNEA